MDFRDSAKKVLQKYMAQNPPSPLKYRAFYSGGVRRGKDYRYIADMDEIFPSAKTGDKADLKCLYISECDTCIGMRITLFGSAVLYVNGEKLFSSDIFTERNNHIDNKITVPVRKGINEVYFKFKKTALGFGCIFGTHLAKWDYIFMDPMHPDREGCIYRLNGGGWLPADSDREPYTLKDGEYALFYAKTKDGKDVYIKKNIVEFPADDGYTNAFCIEGAGAWAALYPLKGEWEISEISPVQGVFWQLKYKNLYVRPYYGRGNFGKWNYPLGVVLYGIMAISGVLKDEIGEKYAIDHIQRTIDTFDYAFFDKNVHGGSASLHNLLSSIDSLDDCGAFAASVEEAVIRYGLKADKICDFTADYIENKQPRNEDGSFCRRHQLHSFHNETMWLDDMYMSVPFLVRRYIISGNKKYINDAANQFVQFKKWLYMEDKNLMSHVYDLRHDKPTLVPWGRGNGWFIFSLTELLLHLPQDHPKRNFLEEFFKTLAKGYLCRQSADGRWRQVIDDEESYLETSCSAMFAASFARGFKMGLLGTEYMDSAVKAAESICRNCIDEEGNLYGVCRGSEFSFSYDYYKYDLLPKVNDTHGVGIVLIALAELL